MYVCVCNAITEKQVRQSVAGGASTLEDLQVDLGVASCCGTCVEAAETYLPGAVAVSRPESIAAVDGTPVRWVSRGPRQASRVA
ncbi:MAG: (2Fe-2S)-binding protein [Pigmentiphaga sp.]